VRARIIAGHVLGLVDAFNEEKPLESRVVLDYVVADLLRRELPVFLLALLPPAALTVGLILDVECEDVPLCVCVCVYVYIWRGEHENIAWLLVSVWCRK
jgi:hypothetical protein